MAGRVNKSPLCAREGKIYIDGTLVADSCKFQLYFTPKVWEGKTLSEKGTNRRWIGYDITGTLEQWKTTNMYVTFSPSWAALHKAPFKRSISVT